MMKHLRSVNYRKGLETVKDSAFFGAENWTGVDRIPSTVKTIGAYGFAECKGSKLTIPEGIAENRRILLLGI